MLARLSSAPKQQSGAAEQLSPLRSQLPRPQADLAKAVITPFAETSQPPLPAMQHHQPATRLQGEIRSLSAESNELQELQEAQQPRPAHGSTLGKLLAEERRKEKAELAQLVHAALPNGGAVMTRLKDRAVRQQAKKWHPRLTGAPKPMEGKRGKDFETLVRADVMALAETGRMDPLLAVHKMREAVEDGPLGQGILANDRQLLLDVLDHLANPIDRLYQQQNLKLTSDTLPAYTNAVVLEKPTKLREGKSNTVFAVKLMDPDGGTFDGVFKPLKATENSGVATAHGIPENDPQIAMRNIATVAYAKKLGLDVIADTRVAVIDTGRGPLDPDLGLIMERARGKPASETDPNILARPDVCAEVTKLQLLDHLTGQTDRHANNYFINIDIDPNGHAKAKVTGIDNDLCFSEHLIRPEDIQTLHHGTGPETFRGTGLPPVVDTEMKRAIEGLTEGDIRSMLGDKLSEAEIEAAIDRHQGVIDHMGHLLIAGKVIEPTQWGDPDVQQLLTGRNSYAGRDRNLAA